MPKFECLVVRKTYTSVIIEVDAEDAKDAYLKADLGMNTKPLFEGVSEGCVEYSIEDITPAHSKRIYSMVDDESE